MAMYYHSSSEIQADGLHTLYLMNPNYIPQSNMLFTNSVLAPHAPPPPPPQQDHHYTMWGSGNNNNLQTSTPRGLSLSLAAHHQQTGFGDQEFPAAQSSAAVISPNNSSSPSNAAIMGSKYLKAAQELLDEVVNVGNHRTDKEKPIKDPAAAANKDAASANRDGAVSDLTTAQRQEIQMKKAKLLSMLDEVEQRCQRYHQHMQMIVAALEQVAGTGSARSYTQLAMKTILKQFRCLKSTISAQVKALNKSLGEGQAGSELTRLRFVGRQQVGMVQNNAWRPQRGLPERAVTVLRAWLFQHFLHPYPKNSDKQMLAKQTGLTRSQVSNWFINARVRLWKPMVEEMYLQETNDDIKAEPTKLSDGEPDNKPPLSDNCVTMPNMSSSEQGNAFSLSLALPPTHTFLSHHTFQDYQMIDFQNRKPQLLPDFLASTPGFIN